MAQLKEMASKKAEVDEVRKKKKEELELNKGKVKTKKRLWKHAKQTWITLKQSEEGNWFAMVHQALCGGEKRLHTNIKNNFPNFPWLYNGCNCGFYPPQCWKNMHLAMARLWAKRFKVQVLDPTFVEPSWAHKIDSPMYVNWLWIRQVPILLT